MSITVSKWCFMKNVTLKNFTIFTGKLQTCNFEHVYMRPEMKPNQSEISNRFEMLLRLHGNLHGDFTAATFQTTARLSCTCANDIF